MSSVISKYSWIIFFLIGVVILSGAIPHSLGINTDPGLVQSISGNTLEDFKSSTPQLFQVYDYYFRGGGLSDFGVAFFIIIIACTAYRKFQLWSWYTFWFVPVYFFAWIIISYSLPSTSFSSLLPPLLVLSVLSIIAQLISYKNFSKN